ncbi:MAG: hypothetical protein PVF46_04205 [Lysobacterales bacterium]
MMLTSHFLDLVPIWLLFAGTVLVMTLFIECGFRLGKNAQAKAKKAQTSQVRAIMGAGLGLLAFMLAFTFSTAQTHFETRVQSLAEEARIARNAFIQTDLLGEPGRTQAKQLLQEYVAVRTGMRLPTDGDIEEQLAYLIRVSEKIQNELWLLVAGEAKSQAMGEQGAAGPLLTSVLALIDIHYTRVHSAIMNRIPLTIWITLYLMAILSMIIMGYQAGLTDRRSPVATITLAVAFAAVITLITDLDRPVMSFFHVNNQLLLDLFDYMQASMQPAYLPGRQG